MPAVVPSAADLKAYDALLAGASRVRFTLDNGPDFQKLLEDQLQSKEEAYRFYVSDLYRADVDGVRGAFYIIKGSTFSFAAYKAGLSFRQQAPTTLTDIVLGDGSDGPRRVVQTITSNSKPGSPPWTAQSMDRGDTLRIKVAAPQQSCCTLFPYIALVDPFWKCRPLKQSITAEREATTEMLQNSPPESAAPTGIRLVMTPELNKAKYCCMWACLPPTVLTAGLMGFLLNCFCWRPSDTYELQDDTGAPLGGGRYKVPRPPCVCQCEVCVSAPLALGSAPLEARRLAVAAVVNHQVVERARMVKSEA